MKTSPSFPPNYQDILKVFPSLEQFKPIFTYSDTIYNPYNIHIDAALERHEQTHTLQQGDHPEIWWTEYLTNKAFRLSQEVDAYRAQWAFASDHYSRDQRRALLDHITTALSSPLYGSLVSKKEAKELITKG